MKYLVTGGYGFIGSNFILKLLSNDNNKILNIDKVSYCSSPGIFINHPLKKNLKNIEKDINDVNIKEIFSDYKPDVIVHFAAESHVDRSIDSPIEFIDSNILASYKLLEGLRSYFKEKKNVKYIHISTDEVYGSLDFNEMPFTEDSNYLPSSPYSASKASSDHLALAWHKTYGLPIIITNCSNNYGPWQFPEKLIPLTIINIINKNPINIYGSGINVRDWLYVRDHVDAIIEVSKNGKVGEKYNIGGSAEISNIDLVNIIIKKMEEINPIYNDSQDLIKMVSDRPGHDLRYAIDAKKISSELHWLPKYSFDDAIEKTIKWYLDNKKWWQTILNKKYQGNRLGVID